MIDLRIALALAVVVAGCAPGSQADPGAPTAGSASAGPTPAAPAASPPAVQAADGVEVTVLEVEQRSDSFGSGVSYRLEVRNDRGEPIGAIPPQAGPLRDAPAEEGLAEAATPASREQRGDEAPPTVDTVVVGPGQTLALDPPSGAQPVSEGIERLRVCVEILDLGPRQVEHGQSLRVSLDPAVAAQLACSEPTPIGG